MTSFFVGCRVTDSEGYKATVRYIGPVIVAKDKNEIWIGVEWDDKTRGKHDGSCVDDQGQVHRYFKCDFGAGSFIKPSKLSRGRSFVEALRDRYVDLDAPTIVKEGTVLPDAFVTTAKGIQKTIEFVGEEKIRKHQQLSVITKVSIRNDSISVIGDNASAVAGHLTEVDLQDNLLCQWSEVANFGLAMPGLTTLLLHGNKLELLTSSIAETLQSLQCFQCLQVLALNACKLSSWREVVLLNTFLPQLEELYLTNNDLSDIPSDYNQQTNEGKEEPSFLQGFEKLRILDVSYCKINDWSQIQFFGKLSALKELIMDGNAVANVQIPLPDTFTDLQRLSLGATSISAWSDIDKLNAFPALHVLRISQIPLFTGKGASEVRPCVIGRVTRLSMLNGSVIGARERRDAEKIYLRTIFSEKAVLKATGGDESELDSLLTVAHPRYHELKALYEAEMVPAAKSSGEKTNLAAEMISITLHNMIIGASGPSEPVTKKLPASLLVGKLRILIKQVFGVDPQSQHLALRVYKDSIPNELDDDQSSLQYYGAIDGADIFINEKA